MSSLFEKSYRVTPKTALTDSFWNSVLKNIDTRLVGVEDKKASFEDAEKQMLAIGLKRINETIQPAAEKIQRMSELGFMVASSEELLKPEDGRQLSVVLIKGDQADVFAPSPFVALVRRSTPDTYAIGRLLHYDRQAARVDLQIVSVQGDAGPYDDWDVAALAGAVMATSDALIETRKHRNAVADDRSAVANDRKAVSSSLTETQAAKTAAEKARKGADDSLADFKKRYLGPLKTLPQNAALGTLALDTGQVPNVMKQMTETGWMPTVTVSVGGSRLQIFIAQADSEKGPYKVDGGFTTGAVFVNGVMLFNGYGVNFDIKAGTFTLNNGVRKGSQIVFQGYLANDVTDIYTKKEADRKFDELEKRTRVPVGFEGFIESTLPPDGWLVANGNLHNITAYPDLFAWCGTRWGGDGIKTFRIPDRRGLFPRAVDNGRGIDLNRVLGSNQEDMIKAHMHPSNMYLQNNGSILSWVSPGERTGGEQIYPTGTFGGSETRPKNYALLPIIKY